MSSDSNHHITFKPMEEKEIDEIAKRQSGTDIADMFDCKPGWAQLTAAQLREKVDQELKKPHTAVFSIYSSEELVGIGEWSASWDTWSPYAWFVVLPGHRRKGLGTAIASMLLGKCFMQHPGHEVAVGISESNVQAAALLSKLCFKEIGRMRRASMEDGKYRDLLFFDILKSEYLAGVKQ
ncbi:MAG: GNAT family protein [Thermoplasmata archaeon]